MPTKPLARVTTDLEQAVTRHKFGVLGVHDLVIPANGVLVFSREANAPA